MKILVNVLIVLCVILAGPISADNLIGNPSFETQSPAFWEGTAGTSWEATEVFAGFYSFKVTKSAATSSEMGWTSVNNANLYWNHASDRTYSLSAMVKTVGVNTSPADNDAKIGLVFTFKDAAGAELTSQTIWADQTTASVDWDTLQGVAILTATPASVVVKAIMGKDATGTVYFDNIGCGTDPWSMGLFNGNAETIDGWLNWYSSTNGSWGTVTDNQAKTGTHSAELFKPDTTASTSEIVYYSVPVAVEAGEWYTVGVWVKTEDVNDSIDFEPTYIRKERLDERIGLCYFFHIGDIATSWDLSGGDKYVYIDQRDSTMGWTHYVVAEQAPDDATGISVRARFTSNPTGTAWFDDFEVTKMVLHGALAIDNDVAKMIPQKFELLQNYPNPFNPQTAIEFRVPYTGWINLTVYNLLGQKVRTLVNGVHEQGQYRVMWDSRNEVNQMVSTGIYLYTLTTDKTRFTNKMLLLR